MKKIILLIICIALIITVFTACDKDNPSFNAPKLDTPTNVRFDGTNLMWDAVENADRYVVTVFTNTSSYTLTIAETVYEVPVSSSGSYIATIKARKSDGSFKDSELTEPITYHLGAGTQDDPILIYSVKELQTIGIGATITTVDSKSVTTPKYYKLDRDIDLNGVEWAPIGVGDNRFQGHFDGQGYTISNFKITQANGAYHGLFKGVLNGSIKNLNISNYTINIIQNGAYQIGGIAGYVSNSEIINCTVSGTINYRAPGWSTGSDTRTQYIGQLIGNVDNSSLIAGCKASGTLIVEGYSVYAGGLVGRNYGSNLISSSSTGEVNVKGRTLYVGGFAGGSMYASAYIENSYSRASVSTEGVQVSNAGGLVGYFYNSSTIKNSYSTGSVTSTTATTTRTGFIGYAAGSSIVLEGLYYDYETMGLGNPKDTGNTASHAKIFSRTTDQMKQQSTFLGWDFDDIWYIDSELNDGYPSLRPYVEPEEDEEEDDE